MSTIRVQVTAADIANANTHPGRSWWAWPVQTALEAVIGADVDIDRDVPEGYMATVGAQDEMATLVLTLDANAEAFLDARYDHDVPGEPFFFELTLPDWLCALAVGAIDAEYEPTCRICGCTNERACAGGCVWVGDPEGLGELCSACLPKVPA